MAHVVTSPRLHDAYADALPASRALFERARRLFPDAVTHDNRRMQPFPLYVDRADGAHKWDVDGRRYVGYWMGHGALLLGHNPPPVRDAVREQALILAREKVAWKVYGEHSDWKIFFGADAPPRDGADQSVAPVDWRRLDARVPRAAARCARRSS